MQASRRPEDVDNGEAEPERNEAADFIEKIKQRHLGNRHKSNDDFVVKSKSNVRNLVKGHFAFQDSNFDDRCKAADNSSDTV